MHHTTNRPIITYITHPSRRDCGVITHATLAAAYRHALRLSLAGYGVRIEDRREVRS